VLYSNFDILPISPAFN